MATRGRNFNKSQEWDPMREDFNNTTYDAQYPDDDASDGVQLDHCRLYITNIPKGLNDEGLRSAFANYGNLVEVHLSKDPQKRYALVSFESPSEAKLAMMKMNRTEPLKLNLSIAHKNKRSDRQRSNVNSGRERSSYKEDTVSIGSKGKYSRKEETSNGDGETMNGFPVDEDMSLTDPLDASLNLELENLKLEQLKIREEQLMCKHRMLLLKQAERKPTHHSSGNTRCILPDGRIVVRNVSEHGLETRDADATYAAGAGDSNETTLCSCKTTTKSRCSWEVCSDDSSTPSTCILCSEEPSVKDKSELSRVTSKLQKSTDTVSKRSDATSKKDVKRFKSDDTCDLKFSDFYTDSEDEDETNRLIQLRNADYMDIVDEDLKVVVALAGYPKSRMRLKQMEQFQKCLNNIVNMQMKNGLLKRPPVFIDYYLNRGAIVCICKDSDTRDWVVRISPGMQERMNNNLVLLKAKVKRLCLAVLKIPRVCWPTTAKDAFKLLQYFNPTLKTHMWRIYSQKITDDVECTSFLIDRVSGEIIRGPSFKNVIDYEQMEFELTGYTEIYYECLLSSMHEDLSSVASRVKLLEELKSEQNTPRNASEHSKHPAIEEKEMNNNEDHVDAEMTVVIEEADDCEELDVKEIGSSRKDVLKKLKDVQYVGEKDEVLIWSDETNDYASEHGTAYTEVKNEEQSIDDAEKMTSTSFVAVSENADSITDSTFNLIARGSNLNIDSNRGIAYHRRTNYLHVENELKVAITLEGYPQNKLEGTHIRRLKHLFKEYLHKDMKLQKFGNLIIPKFQDIYLSNGAVIYICDSLETKDYLTEVLPKFINSTGLKLTFRDISSLVRYTRIVMRLPKEIAHLESMEILQKLHDRYPNLKPECWKYYSDVAGKQKRQFGVDPQSLEVIKGEDFDATYEGETLSFRIIDRQKRDVSFDERSIAKDDKKQKAIVKNIYVPIDAEIMNAPLTRIRTNHYSDIIPDDLKLYLGPSNYPECRIDETLFHTIKLALEDVVCEAVDMNEITVENIPKIHDIYLFDGVIFIICQNAHSRLWIEGAVPKVNEKFNLQLKSTEFRGAVGIISMVVRTDKDVEEVIDVLQSQNPRLRTKYWRKISTVRTKTKLDVVLQIDKLSALVITSKEFNKYVGKNAVQFKLGHLQSLLKPKASLEELTKKYIKREKKSAKTDKQSDLKDESKSLEAAEVKNENLGEFITIQNKPKSEISDLDPIVIEPDTVSPRSVENETIQDENIKVVLKIPLNILPDSKDDLSIIFDLLEDKNPGLNTELWQVYTESNYPSNGKFILYVDKQSVSIIKSKDFTSYIGGEKLRFYF
ncbi:uncharacterized protein LOC115453310 isoform X1 [Manduca sexta]|uniref:uncharacterized protein LOC115453310 isoform X1 n=2 Tax=Manduca sexta TaxID=7130 RepID=UPI00189097F2|nr:uncharacterized protein LOC115453310 isoform X1 [Manduca sexta]